MSDWGTQNATPTRIIQWEYSWINGKKGNNDKHGKHCHEKQKKIPRFVVSVDAMLGNEALNVLTNLSLIISEKLKNSFCMCVAGLMSGSKSRSRDHTPV